ncbi:hypothetical protein QCA50_015408 [Cerrena zonata]|uniref:Secreted protein n=1 Tax=Cerrena zonata TaxID=2478898 RepID=A0AAW0FQ13_9APHY
MTWNRRISVIIRLFQWTLEMMTMMHYMSHTVCVDSQPCGLTSRYTLTGLFTGMETRYRLHTTETSHLAGVRLKTSNSAHMRGYTVFRSEQHVLHSIGGDE